MKTRRPPAERWTIAPQLRRAIQLSSDSIRTLARRYHINPKTVMRWRKRNDTQDQKRGPKHARSTVLSPLHEATIAAFRESTLLPLDDCLSALRTTMPQLTRSSLHRCLRRSGLSIRPSKAVVPPAGSGLLEPGCFDLNVVHVSVGNHALCAFIAVERYSKFSFARLYQADSVVTCGADFLGALTQEVPHPVRIIAAGPHISTRIFERACRAQGLEYQRRQPNSAGGWVMPASPDEAIAPPSREFRRLDRLQRLLNEFLRRYNHQCRLTSRGGMTPADCLAGYRIEAPTRRSTSRTTKSWDSAKRSVQSAAKISQSKRARDPTGTREQILNAARRRLAQDGPEGLSLAEVARLANVSRGTAYRHFQSRGNLITAATEGVSERLYAAVFGRPVLRDRGEIDAADLSDRLCNFAMDNPELGRAWLLQVLSSQDPAKDIFWREFEGLNAGFAKTKLAQSDIDNEVASLIMLAGVFLWPVWARTQAKDNADLRRLARRFADESLRLSMYGNMRAQFYPKIARRLARSRKDPPT